jgi:hypothetical protein
MENFEEVYHRRLETSPDKRSLSPSRNPLRTKNVRERPTLANTFGWSSTYIPYYDNMALDEEFEIIDS